MIDEFESLSEKVSITKFCNDKNISKDSFYYFRKKFKKYIRINYKNNIFQEIKINEEATTTNNNTTLTTGEVNITIGNINIAIPVSETTLIALLLKELVTKC